MELGAPWFSAYLSTTATMTKFWTPGKTAQGYYDVGDNSWVALAGAAKGQQDLFVQFDWMVGVGHSHDPRQFVDPGTLQTPLDMVQSAFSSRGIHVHFVKGNAIQEDTCTDDLGASPPVVCMYPNEPGVVAWKWGLEMLKAWPLNPDSCATGGDCTPHFRAALKDSYHYVLFGHSVSSPSWSIQAGTLRSIAVSNGWATVTTSARPADQYGNVTCPARVTIDGAIATPDLNGIYDVLPPPDAPPGTTGCPSNTTFTILVRPDSTVNVPDGTYPNTLPEPELAIYTSQPDTTSGFSDVGGSDTAVTLGKWPPPLGTWPVPKITTLQVIATEAGTLMHELGHTLTLTHGGRNTPNGNSPDLNCKPNYQSVMNYFFQFDLLGTPDLSHPYGYLDYSDRALSTLDETNLIPWPGLVAPAFPQETKWFSTSQPPNAATTVATYCDGTPVGSGTTMWEYRHRVHRTGSRAVSRTSISITPFPSWTGTVIGTTSTRGRLVPLRSIT